MRAKRSSWVAALLALALVGCSLPIRLPFELPFAKKEPTLAPATIAPPADTPTPAPATATATEGPTATIAPTMTLSPTLTATMTMTPTATISDLMPPAKTLIAAHTATFVPPQPTGRATQPINVPLEALPTRAPRAIAPTFTPEVVALIPGGAGDGPEVTTTPTESDEQVEIEFTWQQSVNGLLIEASGLARNATERAITMISIDIAFRDDEGTLLATAQAVAAPNEDLQPGEQAAWTTAISNPGNVSVGEVVSVEWLWVD